MAIRILKLLIVICILLKTPCLGAESLSSPILLKMNHQFPENTMGSKVDAWFADQVNKRTNGQVIIKIFWSNQLGEPRDNLSLISRGVLDMAAMSPGYFPDNMPLLAAPNSIPMAMDNVCQAKEIMEAFIRKVPEVSKEAKTLGIRPLFFHVLNPYYLVSKTPITKLDHLKGKRIRTWGSHMPELIRSAGAKPVPLFLPDVYPALEKGIIDGCPFSLDLMVSYDIYKIAGHVSEVILWEGPGWGIWISEAVWEKLPEKVQQVILETAAKAVEKDMHMALEAEKQARVFLRSKGARFHTFPKSDIEIWKASSPDFFNAFIQKMENQGKKKAAIQMVEIWQQLRQKITCP